MLDLSWNKPLTALITPCELIECFVDNQNGFRQGKSTSSALAKFLDDLITDLNCSKTDVVAYLDFKKAFDTINHTILLGKLQRCGIGENLIRLLRNYLTIRH